jgi:hypothetical protein
MPAWRSLLRCFLTRWLMGVTMACSLACFM